jgi:hypothetical protein
MKKNLLFRLAVAAVALSAASFALAGEFTETLNVDADELSVVNLIGEMRVVPGSGDAYEIVVNVRGDDADRDRIRIEQDGDVVRIVFPVDKERDYVYPPMGRGKTQIRFSDEEGDGSFWSKVLGALGAERVTVRAKGKGLEVWADVEIRAPRGASTRVRLGVGEARAEGIVGDVTLDTNSGAVVMMNIEGDVLADTGSGRVEITGVRGDVSADTGSGSVKIVDARGESVLADTGSGSVRVEGVVCRKLHVDTGSGDVKALDIDTDAALIDTGSGSVTLELVRMGDGKFIIDTGSGGVTLVLPPDASALVTADTGSGGVDVDVDGARIERKNRDEVRFTVGGGDAHVVIDTGSGGVRIKG